jgi:microcystin-dependent protein
MGEPFLGEIKMASFNFPPKGWALCNGQFMPINQNQPLFALLGTTYGGNGQTTFALPNLRGRTPIHFSSITLGTSAGQEAHTLTSSEMPAHNHFVTGNSTAATTNTPASATRLANSSPVNLYSAFSSVTTMDPGTILNVGGSQAHNNMQPYLTISFIVALQGIFPSRN